MKSHPIGGLLAEARSGFASGERDPDGVIQLRMNNVGRNGEFVWDSFLRVPTDPEITAAYALRPGDVLFNNTNSTELVGKTALFAGHAEPVVFSNHFTRLRTKPDLLDPGYLARWLNLQWRNKVFEDLCNRWVGQSAVQLDALSKLEIPLPPLKRQQEIVARLDAQLSAAIRARAAVAAQLADAEKLEDALLCEIFGSPDTGTPVKLADTLASPLRTGNSKAGTSGATFRCLTLSSVRRGNLDFNASRITGLDKDEALRSQVKAGAFYIVRGNGNKKLVGRGALAPVQIAEQMAFPDLLFEVQPQASKLRADYLRWVWDSPNVRRQIEDASATAAGIYKINQKNLAAITLPLPSLSVQKALAAKLNDQLSGARSLTDGIVRRLADLDRLPAALLREAFAA